MKRDHHISKLIKESGVVSAPEEFSASVMDKIGAIPEKAAYKPLIGRWGRVTIILFIVSIILVAVIYANPSSDLFGHPIALPQLEMQWPQLHLNLEFLRQIKFSSGVVSALAALFILVLSDEGLRRRKLMQ
jgi:hypothetical protein